MSGSILAYGGGIRAGIRGRVRPRIWICGERGQPSVSLTTVIKKRAPKEIQRNKEKKENYSGARARKLTCIVLLWPASR